jgi:2-polyprenyl-3-methyl-5-hydroxy-6-metoxy-1,4-benzoquinol methylase
LKIGARRVVDPVLDRVDIALTRLENLSVAEIDAKGVSHHLYGPKEARATERMRFDRERFALFASILAELGQGPQVLDLGANPYILSYLLASEGANVISSGHPLPAGLTRAQPESVTFSTPEAETALSIPLVRFNVEVDEFPFPDSHFDAVICGELIEHLPNGPFSMLHETNRVLRTGGLLILSTPNAVSFSSLLLQLKGMGDESGFSAQGLYARHHRLYRFDELEDLFEGNGFQVSLRKGVVFMTQREWYANGPMGFLRFLVVSTAQHLMTRDHRRAECAVLAGHKVGGPSDYRPLWLYGGRDGIPMIPI